jgi:DNA adenine methylase
VVNDIYGELINFWRVLQNREAFLKLLRRLEATPFSQDEWRESGELKRDAARVEQAVAFFIRARQSRQGLMRDFATLSRNRTRRGMTSKRPLG